MRGGVHFFDVDHTIMRGSTGRRFVLEVARRGLLKYRHIAVLPLDYIAYRLGGGLSFFEGDFPAIEGIEKCVLEEISIEVFEESTRRALRPDMLSRIAAIKAAGGAIVLATSSLDFIVEPLASFLGAETTLATALEYDSGRCTGRIKGLPLFGSAKRDAALALAAELEVRPSDCAFYSDSIHDLPLLLEVGQPVAVAPDRMLRREAKSRGWEILEPRWTRKLRA